MTQNQIFQTLIKILKAESLRTEMEFKPEKAKVQIIEALKSTELLFVGAGIYSVVVEHKDHPGRVFKVSTSRWDGYRAYAKYCQEHVGEELLPIIYSANMKGNFAWYEIEKYYDITTGISKTGMITYITRDIKNCSRVLKDLSYGFDIDSFYIENQIDMKFMQSRKKNEYKKKILELARKANKIYSEFEEKYRIDVHNNNLMITVDNRIIITDPLAENHQREIPVTESDPVPEDFA